MLFSATSQTTSSLQFWDPLQRTKPQGLAHKCHVQMN